MMCSISANCSPGRRTGSAAIVTLLVLGWAAAGFTAAVQQGFDSPEQALAELVAAAGVHDTYHLLAILGPAGEELIFSGDPVQDQVDREAFVRMYRQNNRLDKQDPRRVIAVLGPDQWPFPIPIVDRDGRWYFDSQAGAEELLNRRIGRNELKVIEILDACTDAQREYAAADRNGDGVLEYAQRIISSRGAHDGLYWPVGRNEAPSPLGPMMAAAARDDYPQQQDDDLPPSPYYGYYFRIVKKQGGHASGGAYDYLVNGRMIFGFALVAYPAEYGASGIVTFMVNAEGVVYEKDLGENTETLALELAAFDPDPSWSKAAGQ